MQMHDADYMRLAIAEARLAMGHTHPNPAVGAVIVQGGEVVARGHTQPAGHDHAEIAALKAYRGSGLEPDPSTCLYVTMEPCSTHGRTPPCTGAIIESGIRTVVIGTVDPNPIHMGAGEGMLRDAGVEVRSGILQPDCEDLNLVFNWVMEKRSPLLAGKIATTIDGRIATRGGVSKWITGTQARHDVHFWRNYFPAIAVGAGTILTDDPSLTVRLEGKEERCPIRFVFDRNLITFHDGLPRVYSDQWKERTVVITTTIHAGESGELADRHGIRFWCLDDTHEAAGMEEFCARCHEEGIDGVLVEGGARLLSSMIHLRKLCYLFAYRAPVILGDQSALAPFLGMDPATFQDAIHLHTIRHGQFGDDQLMRGFVVYPDA